jgi:hypothetical protein
VVFARKPSDNLTSLVKKFDAAVGEKKIKAFVCFLNDDEKLADELKALSKKAGIKNTPFTIDNPSGPGAYKIAKEADVTVLLYNKHTVEANHAFRKGELTPQAIEMVVKDLSKITADSKK